LAFEVLEGRDVFGVGQGDRLGGFFPVAQFPAELDETKGSVAFMEETDERARLNVKCVDKDVGAEDEDAVAVLFVEDRAQEQALLLFFNKADVDVEDIG
jgi:hypothetical protein